ncbi:MAG: M28 family peptidase [Thermodesulfovibrionales bacterium]|nr:M28 family peptidase [Thermodesulfovibrionales bacterium]
MSHTNGIKSNLTSTVGFLSEEIGARSYHDVEKLNRAADFIEKKFLSFGCEVKRQPFNYREETYYNIICEVKGSDPSPEGRGLLVIGAHYDTVWNTPGADDNASGVAGLIELARLASSEPLPQTVRFAAFSMEEPPLFRTKHMGSYACARALKDEGVKVMGMISLEMIGYFCERKGCQFYPLPFFRWIYPDKGDFVAFVGNISSRPFTRRVKKAFHAVSGIPVESLNTISLVPGVDFSDHSSFWKFGFPAFMITDTAFYRNPNYHGPGDTAPTLDYDRMAGFVTALYEALKNL